jgi:hypothetical protein
MADSLIIANSIELLGGAGGTFSTFPQLENTIFVLNDGNGTFDLGAPQPTVDILASLITDGERPIGRRASNRTLSIPIAIVSDSRDNLTLARETLFALVDAQQTEQWTLTYTRDFTAASSDTTQGGSGAASAPFPLVLECFRAEPATLAYSMPTENQFVFEVVINCQALPYGRADATESITFLSPASGSTPPPAPITLDLFDSLQPGQPTIWQLVPTHVQGTASIYCPSLGGSTPQDTRPVYKNMNIGGPLDFTAGTGTPQLNVVQFWAGFASQKYYNDWKNHRSEVRFFVTLFDVEGHNVSATRQYTVPESNDLSNPKWTSISVRLPIDNQDIDWTNIVGYQINVQNFLTSSGAVLRNSNVFLDLATAVAPSASVANEVRGSIYKLNGVDGTVHATLNIIAQQQPAAEATTVVLNPGQTWIDPAGVSNVNVTEIGPGGAGGSAAAGNFAGGGGGGEIVEASQVPVTPGNTYAPTVPSSQKALTTGAFSGFTTVGTFNNAGPVASPSIAPSAATSGSLVLVVAGQLVTASPSSITDSVGNVWQLLGNCNNGNIDTEGWVYGTFNPTSIPTSGNLVVNGFNTAGPVEIVLLEGAGIAGFGRPPSQAFTGDDVFPRAEVAGFINTNATTRAGLANWFLYSGADTVMAVNSSPPSLAPYATCLELSSTLAGDDPGIQSNFTVVNNGENIRPKILGFAAASMSVNLVTTWYAAGFTQISSVTDSVTFTAGSWQWQSGAVHTPPSNAQYFTVASQIASNVVANPLNFTHLGAVYTTPIGLTQLGVLINFAGTSSTATVDTGWSNIYNTQSESPLSLDVFTSAGIGVGGDICVASYGAPTQWASMSVNLSLMAGQTIFPGDAGNVVADGGCSVPLSSPTGGAGGSGGTYDGLPAPVHNDGGPGANGASPSGGGGGSSAGLTSGSRLPISSGTIAEAAGTPPVLCMSPLPISQSVGVGGVTAFNYGILNYGSNGTTDKVLVVVIPQSGSGSYVLTDSQSNKYTNIATFSVNGQTATLWENSVIDNNALTAGADSFSLTNAASGNYVIIAYVWRNASLTAGSSATHGVVTSSWTSGMSASLASGALNSAGVGLWALALATDGNETTAKSSAPIVQVDDENFATNFGGANPGFQSTVLDTFWMNSTGTGGDTFNFSRTVASSGIELAVVAVKTALASNPWSNGVNAGYFDGISKYSALGGATMTITFGGSHAQLMGLQGPNQGQFMVNVDGGPWQTVDNYAQNYAYQSVLFDTGALPDVTHTMNIVVLGRSNPSSTNTLVDIDGYQILTGGKGNSGAGVTGGAAVPPGAAGGNGGTNAAGFTGVVGSGGGGASRTSAGTNLGGNGGSGYLQLEYFATLPPFNTLILHRPSLDGSKTLQPYIACSSQSVPTNDQVQPIDAGTQAHFKGTYTMMVAATAWNSPTTSRTVTVTVNEYERPGGAVTESQSVSLSFTPSSPPPGMGNNIIMVGELTLPGKAIPPDNTEAVYFVSVNSSNSADTIQDVMMLDTMGQTVYVNDSLSYAQFFVDEPTPDTDLGLILGSQYDRSYAISVLDSAYPSGGPLTAEPGDNILFAYSYQGAPALICSYFPKFYIDRPVS